MQQFYRWEYESHVGEVKLYMQVQIILNFSMQSNIYK